MTIAFEVLWNHVISRSSAADFHFHGKEHWRRVERNGLQLATRTGADVSVVRLFAIFHDCCRINEDRDDDHGVRGAQLAASLRGSLYVLSDNHFKLLHYACEWHTDCGINEDPTIGSCWDADRLDLGRVGVIPEANYMSTAYGRELAEAGCSSST